MKGYHLDPDVRANAAGVHFAVIYAPRTSRGRFPEECVELMESKEKAIESAEPDKKRYAAQVIGPARSSEGFRIYYLEAWLEQY